MEFGRFYKDFDKLDQYHNPNFEDGLLYDELHEKINAMRVEAGDRDHRYVEAEIFEFIMKNAAIDVNPLDPFGVNIEGWVPDRAKSAFRAMRGIKLAWERELYGQSEEGKRVSHLRSVLWDTGAGWSYPDNDHSYPDWKAIIELGLSGLLERVIKYRDEKYASGNCTEDNKIYYETVSKVCEAFIFFVNRVAEIVKRRIDESDRMPMLYEGLISIANNPPKNIYEVMLLTFVYSLIQEYVCGIQTRTLGNIDWLWKPYYEKAIAEGQFSRENIKELFKYFYMRYEFQGHPHAQPVYLGGTTPDGIDRVNDLTYVILEAYEEINTVSPKLQLVVSEKNPDEYVKKALSMIRNGHTSIVFVNEEMGKKNLRYLSDNEDDINDPGVSGCYNFSLKGNIQPESAGVSFVKGVELALNNGTDPLSGRKIGIETGNAEDFCSFEDFYEAYFKQTYNLIDYAIEISYYYDKNFIKISPAPLLSAVFEKSVKDGVDHYSGGSKYHHTCITISCIGSAADSLYAVKKFVFDEKRLTLTELRDILKNNWEGHEELRLSIAKDKEKYGNDIDAVDNIAKDIMHRTAQYIFSNKNYYGFSYSPDGEGITHGITFGKNTGATPDGRLAGEQLSKNWQSVFGCDTNGVTAYLNSATKIDSSEWPNGAPIDFMLHPSSVKGDHGLDIMLWLIRTTFKKGAVALQGNVCDAETLKAAQREPDKYKGLQVRICGWSQFFNKLSYDEQNMMIYQAETVQ